MIRAAVRAHEGVEVDTEGDAFFVAFATANAALAAAAQAQEGLAATRVRVRMGVHTGAPLVRDGGYIGMDVHRGRPDRGRRARRAGAGLGRDRGARRGSAP